MSELRKAFLKSTGLTFDIDGLLANASADKKAELFNKLNWQMKQGVIVDNITSPKAEENVEVIIKLAESLQLDNIDLDGDGEVSTEELIINEKVVVAKEKKQEIEDKKAETTALKICTLEELNAAIETGGAFSVNGNIVIDTYLNINSDINLFLNNTTIEREGTEGNKTVLYSTAGNITINGEGTFRGASAIWAAGTSNFIIKGGHFIMTCKDPAEDSGYPLIYSTGGTIIIEDGMFESNVIDNVSFKKPQFNLLNVKDSLEQTQIVVKGGKFKNFNPANNYSEGYDTSFVAEGYTVMVNGVENLEPYFVELGDVIYEVVKK